MLIRIIFVFLSLFFIIPSALGAPAIDSNIREVTVGDSGNSDSEQLTAFARSSTIGDFFFTPGDSGSDGILGAFTVVAFQIKNFFIAIAVIFLIIGVIKLLFSSNGDEDVKKWKGNIIWVSVGIFVMQMAFSVWSTLILRNSLDVIGGGLGWELWLNIFSPIVNLLQMLASFGFLFMAVWAFFILVTAGGDEEKAKKSKNTILYAIVGFLLIKIPYALIRSLYGNYELCSGSMTSNPETCIYGLKPEIGESIGIIGKVFTFFNTFLSIICVILILYAGWLVLISGGDEEKLKKAKSTILYIVIGFVVLVASHAIFRFFILKG